MSEQSFVDRMNTALSGVWENAKRADEELASIRAHLAAVTAYAATARSRNTREWMVGLAERLSAATGQAWKYSRIDDALVVVGEQ